MTAHLRLDYHGGGLERPLLGAIAPLLADQPAWRIGVRSHWQGGDHLQLRLSGEAEEHRADIADRLGRWLAAHPSPGLPAGMDFDAFARAQARAEGDTGEPDPLAPDNRISFVEADEPPYLGSLPLAALRLSYEEEVSRDLLALLGHKATARLQSQLVQVMAAYPLGGAAQGVRSLRAHGLHFLDRQPALRPRFEAAYAAHGARLRAEVERILAHDAPKDRLSEALHMAMARLDAMPAADVVAAGQHGLDRAAGSMSRWLGGAVVEGAEPVRHAFGRNRVLVNLVYAQCPLLGIDALTRFACAYLAYRAILDVLGVADDLYEPAEKVLQP